MNLESIQIFPEAIVYKNLIPNPDKILEIIKSTESDKRDSDSVFEKWVGWFHFGTQVSFPWIPRKTMEELRSGDMPEIINRGILDGEHPEEYVAKVMTSAFYNATLDFIDKNKIELPNWNSMGLTVCKYNRDGKDYAMSYHTDYDYYQEEKPGFKFEVTSCIYINDDYEGGSLMVWNDNEHKVVEYKPVAGDVVVFLSKAPIKHGVSKIYSGDKYFLRMFWGRDYEGSESWLNNLNLYGKEVWEKMEKERAKREMFNGKHHFDVVFNELDLNLDKYKISEDHPSLTPLYSPYKKIKMGKNNE